MEKNVSFQVEEVIELPEWTKDYPEEKFTIFKACFLSTKPNAHELDITPDVLKRDAKSILGNFLVAKLEYGDATTHLPSEIIYGYFPKEQEIEFVEENNILKAYAYAVVSKRYSQDFNNIFEHFNQRNSSVEMTVETPENDEHLVLSFNIYGLTTLGLSVRGSCPDADIQMVRFAEEEAEAYFKASSERKEVRMASYTIDKSKEAMSENSWGSVDKAAQRDKLMEADNRDELIKACYLLVEDGWEEAPSEKLKYPVMELKGDTLVYNRGALSSALGYAKQHDESAVVNKVEAIYNKLDLGEDSSGKEEKDMSEAEMAEKTPDTEEVMSEQEEEKMADTEPTESSEGKEKTMAEEPKGEEAKMEEPDDADDCDEKDDDCQMSADEMKDRIAKLEAQVEEKENIIMKKDEELQSCNSELTELRKFKEDIEAKEKALTVEAVLKQVESYMSDEQIAEYRKEGLACEMSEMDAWTNKIKAVSFDASTKKTKKTTKDDFWSFSAPIEPKNKNESENVWDRLKKN